MISEVLKIHVANLSCGIWRRQTVAKRKLMESWKPLSLPDPTYVIVLLGVQ